MVLTGGSLRLIGTATGAVITLRFLSLLAMTAQAQRRQLTPVRRRRRR